MHDLGDVYGTIHVHIYICTYPQKLDTKTKQLITDFTVLSCTLILELHA